MTTLKKKVSRRANKPLDGSFGPDRERRIIITLIPGTAEVPDLIELRPEGTRRPEFIAAIDVYRMALRSRANRAMLEKARNRKAKISASRERARLDRQERKFRESLKS